MERIPGNGRYFASSETQYVWNLELEAMKLRSSSLKIRHALSLPGLGIGSIICNPGLSLSHTQEYLY